MYTTPEQTTKLIELGFEKPKSISGFYQRGPYEYDAETNTKIAVYDDTQYPIYAYSIGELIKMLQKQVYQTEDSGIPCDLNIHYDGGTWPIVYICERDGGFKTERLDLVDALYNMIVTLKEKKLI